MKSLLKTFPWQLLLKILAAIIEILLNRGKEKEVNKLMNNLRFTDNGNEDSIDCSKA